VGGIHKSPVLDILYSLRDLVMRLCRHPCGKPLAFRQARASFGGCAAGGKASPLSNGQSESLRLSARVAAKPLEILT